MIFELKMIKWSIFTEIHKRDSSRSHKISPKLNEKIIIVMVHRQIVKQICL